MAQQLNITRSPDAVQRGAKRNGAPLIRGLRKRGACQERGACDGPGSAAHRSTSFRAALRPGNADTALRRARKTNNVTFPGRGAAWSEAERCTADPGPSQAWRVPRARSL